jgi:hypothetical protein
MFGDRVDARTGRRYPPIALVKHGEPQPARPTWYAPDRRAWHWFWEPQVMNSPERLSQARDRLWPRPVDRVVRDQLRARQRNSQRLRRGR